MACSANRRHGIAKHFHVEGDGKWDCLTSDDDSGRLFLSHGNVVQVIDEKTGMLVGTIPDTRGVHAIALASELNKGFISNGQDDSVTVFNLSTLAITGKIRVTGHNPDIILYDSFTRRVFVFNGKTRNVSVIDARNDAVLGTVPLAGKPEFGVSDANGKIYVNLEDKSQVSVIDAEGMRVSQTWDLKPGESPSGLAIDREKGRLFIVCENKLMIVMDASSGLVITALPIGERPDGTVFDAETKLAYSSNGDGTLTIVHEEDANTFKVLETVVTQKGARTIALNAKTHQVFLPTAEFGPTVGATKDNPRPRPAIKPGSFSVLEVGAL